MGVVNRPRRGCGGCRRRRPAGSPRDASCTIGGPGNGGLYGGDPAAGGTDDGENLLFGGPGDDELTGSFETRLVIEILAERIPSLRLAPGRRLDYFPNITFRGPLRIHVDWDG